MKHLFSLFLLFIISFFSFFLTAKTSSCTWTNPETNKKINIPVTTSCAQARKNKEAQYIKNNHNGYLEDAQIAIDAANARYKSDAQSANKKAKKAAQSQKMGSAATMAGAMVSGAAAAICCNSQCFATWECSALIVLTAGLGAAGMIMGAASSENENIAAQYSGGLLNTDPNAYSKKPNAKGLVFKRPSRTSLKVTLPNGDIVTPDVTGLSKYLKKKGLTWDPKQKKITLPSGKSYTAKGNVLNSSAFKKYANSAQAKKIQNFIKQTKQKLIKEASDNIKSDADKTSDSLTTSIGTGGGGFAGYRGGRRAGFNSGLGGTSLNGQNIHNRGLANNNVAGMSIKRGKDLIGVKQDSIFLIIHRTFVKKRKLNHFIEY